MTLRRPSVFGGAIAGSSSTSFGLRNFVNSSRPCPSGVRIITMLTWTPSSPLTRSTHGPSTGISPSTVMPSAVKKAIAAARSSTTTLTWSNLLIVMSLVWQRPCARRSRPTVLASWTWLAEETHVASAAPLQDHRALRQFSQRRRGAAALPPLLGARQALDLRIGRPKSELAVKPERSAVDRFLIAQSDLIRIDCENRRSEKL